jgi:hypothetical protein
MSIESIHVNIFVIPLLTTASISELKLITVNQMLLSVQGSGAVTGGVSYVGVKKGAFEKTLRKLLIVFDPTILDIANTLDAQQRAQDFLSRPFVGTMSLGTNICSLSSCGRPLMAHRVPCPNCFDIP